MNCSGRYLFAILTACLLFAHIFPVHAIAGARTADAAGQAGASPEESTAPAADCSSPEELVRLLSQDTTGTIVLTRDIEINEKLHIVVPFGRTVEMGPYSIHIAEGSSLSIDGPVHFKSMDAPKPAFLADGTLAFISHAAVSAYGDSSTAIEVSESGSWSASCAAILAEGPSASAVRIKSQHPCRIVQSVIYAKGPDAVGIHTNAPLRLEFSRLESDGASIINGGNELILDTSLVTPAAAASLVIDRYPVLADRLEQNGLCYPQGTSLPSMLPKSLNYRFINKEEPSDQLYLSIPVDWEECPDMSAPGDYPVMCTPIVQAWFPVELPAFPMMLHVVAPDQPFLEGAYLFQGEIHLDYLNELTGADQMILCYSTDGAKTWRDASRDFSVYMDSHHAVLSSIPFRDYWFRLAVIGGPLEGCSNILYFSSASQEDDNFGGGDRDGGDTQEQDIPSITPEPTQEPQDTPPLPAPSQHPGSDSDSNSTPTSEENTSNPRTPEQTAPPVSGTGTAQEDLPEPDYPNPLVNTPVPPVSEEVTDTQTVLSGKRCKELLKINSGYILIEKNKISVELSAAFLKELPLDDDSIIRITVHKMDDLTFQICLEIDGTPVTKIPDTVIRFPYQPADPTGIGQLYLYCQETDTRTSAEYLSDSSIIRGEIQVPGTYSLEEGKKERAVQKSSRNLWLPAAGILGLVILSTVLFCYYRYKRSKHEET